MELHASNEVLCAESSFIDFSDTFPRYYMQPSTRFNKLFSSLVAFEILAEYMQLKLNKGLSTAYFIEYCATVPLRNRKLSQFCRTLLSGNTPLHLAVQLRDWILVTKLKQGFGDVVTKNQTGDTPLHCACCWRCKMEALVLVGSPTMKHLISCQNNYGNTPLHLACFHSGQANLIKILIKSDYSCIFKKNRAKQFPLQVAIQHHKFEYVDILLNNWIPKFIRNDRFYEIPVINVTTIEEYMETCFSLLKYSSHHEKWYITLPQEITTEKIEKLLNNCLENKVLCHTYTVSEKASKFDFSHTNYEVVSCQEIDELLFIWSNIVNVIHCVNTSRNSELHLLKCDLVNCGVDTKNKKGQTPFDEAYLIGHATACVWLMVIKQCSVYLNKFELNSTRCDAVQQICASTLSRFPENSKIHSVVPGDTLLHVAASMKNAAELIHYLTVTMKFDVSKVNSREEYPLHIACRTEHSSKVVKLLLNCDLLHRNVEGDSPLDLLFLHYRYEFVVSVLQPDSDIIFLDDFIVVNEWIKHNSKYTYYGNNSPLHIAIRVCSEVEIKMLKEINLESFMKWCSCGNIFGELPIHLAAHYGNLSTLKLVGNHKNCNAITDQGNTTVHELCKNSSSSDTDLVEVLKFLCEDLHCNIHAVNKKGQTALHICCQRGCSKLVEYLLDIAKLDPNTVDSTGSTSLMITPLGHCEVIQLLIQYGADSSCLYQAYKEFFKSYSSETPPPTPLNVIVVGNHSSGKSTLIKALKSEDRTSIVQGDPLTAGIIPSFSQSSSLGNIMWYDLAGQSEYYASHEAVLNTVMTSSPPLILLLVDIRKQQEVIHQEILYWLHFLLSQVESKKYSVQPHIFVLFSFKDEVQECIQDKIDFSKATLKPFFKKCNFKFVSFTALDCRQPSSDEIQLIRSQIQTSYSVLCDKTQIDFLLHCFYAFLLGNFKNEPAVSMQRILDLTEEWIATGVDPHYEEEEEEDDDSDNSVESFDPEYQFYFEEESPAKLLPYDHKHVFDMCKRLFIKGHVMVIKDSLNTVENSWVVINKDILLKEVNGSLFAPEKFKRHYKDISTNTGVVTLHKLSEMFSDYDSVVLSGFLTYLEFCNKITDNNILQLLELKVESCDDQYFFFPGLVSIEKPEWAWKDSKQSFNKCGWVWHTTDPDRFFTSRFIQVLLLRLAFSYPFSSKNRVTGLPDLAVTQACSVWKNGLFWQTSMGLDCLVEVSDNSQAIVLLFRSTGKPLSERCLTFSFKYRSNLISSILATIEELASSLNIEECVLHPSFVKYPPLKHVEAALYSIRTISKAICSKLPFVPSTSPKYDKAELTDILDFEPFMYTDNYHLFNKLIHKAEVADEELRQLSISLTSAGQVHCAICYNIFAENNVVLSLGAAISEELMYKRLSEWRNMKKATYGDLYSLLTQYSVFGKRDIQELSGCSAVKFVSLSCDSPDKVTTSLKDKPTLPALISFKCKNGQKINILGMIGDKYSDFGTLLLNDDDGSIIETIRFENNREIKPILREIVKHWLRGEGRTVSWETVVEILGDIGLSRLSEDIHSTVQ